MIMIDYVKKKEVRISNKRNTKKGLSSLEKVWHKDHFCLKFYQVCSNDGAGRPDNKGLN